MFPRRAGCPGIRRGWPPGHPGYRGTNSLLAKKPLPPLRGTLPKGEGMEHTGAADSPERYGKRNRFPPGSRGRLPLQTGSYPAASVAQASVGDGLPDIPGTGVRIRYWRKNLSRPCGAPSPKGRAWSIQALRIRRSVMENGTVFRRAAGDVCPYIEIIARCLQGMASRTSRRANHMEYRKTLPSRPWVSR